MKIILLTHVKGLGQKGDIKEVSEGFYRNRLMGQKVAAIATDSTISHVEAQKEKGFEKLAGIKESALAVRDRLKSVELTLKEKASETGKLYGSLSAKEIVFALKNLANVEIPVHALQLAEPIKQVGTYRVKIKLHSEVQDEIVIHVEHA